jgi:hypothetical protein
MRLIGERPQSISGCTLSIITDGNARAMRHQSTEIHIERKHKSDWFDDRCGDLAARWRSVQLKSQAIAWT